MALLDRLQIPKVDMVGWSDGAILGLDMAMRHADRVGRIFAFAANTQTSGVKNGVEKNPSSPLYHACPSGICAAVGDAQTIRCVSGTDRQDVGEPAEWTDAQLRTIRSPVLVVDGDHDEGIKREHTEYIAATIPGARLLILPNVSHFAFLQDPVLFNAALLDFLGDRK